MKNNFFIIIIALVFTKASYSENLTKQDLLKMSEGGGYFFFESQMW